MALLLLVLSSLFAANDMAVKGLTINGPTAGSTFPTTRGTAGQFLKTNGTGTLSWGAPMVVSLILTPSGGALPKTSSTYTTLGGTIRLDVTGSFYCTAVNTSTIDVLTSINAGAYASRGQMSQWCATTGQHIIRIPRTYLITGLAAGTTIAVQLTNIANATIDVNDYHSILLTEF